MLTKRLALAGKDIFLNPRAVDFLYALQGECLL